MAQLFHLSSSNVSDTFHKLVQTEGGKFSDGSGSAISFITSNQTSSMTVATASYAISASHEITYEVSSSHAVNADTSSKVAIINDANKLMLRAQGDGTIQAMEGISFDSDKFEVETQWVNLSGTSRGFSLNGSITASHDISASGRIDAHGIHATTNYRITDATGTSRHIITGPQGSVVDNNRVEIGNSNFTDGIQIINDTTVSGNISASGDINATNISASGDIIMNEGGKLYFDGNDPAGWTPVNTYLHNPGTSDKIEAYVGGVQKMGIGKEWVAFSNGTFKVTGNVTSSGHISASGNIVADIYDAKTSGVGYKLDGVKLVYFDSSVPAYTFGRDAATRISGSTIELSGGHVTASGNVFAEGNISASGHVYGNNFHSLNSHIASYIPAIDLTALGNAAAKHTQISGHNITVAGHMTMSSGHNISGSGTIDMGGAATFGGITLTDSNYDANGTSKYRIDGYSVLENNTTQLKIAGNNYWEEIIYGNQGNDKHTFVGNITASDGGNMLLSGDIIANEISASGKITGEKLMIEGGSGPIDALYYLTSPIVGFVVGNTDENTYYRAKTKHHYLSGIVVVGMSDNFATSASLSVDGNIAAGGINGHITASGNISSSGYIRALEGTFGNEANTFGPTRDLEIKKHGSAYFRLHSTDNANQAIEFWNNQEPDFVIQNRHSQNGFTIGSEYKDFIQMGSGSGGDTIKYSGSHDFIGSITASGCISASGVDCTHHFGGNTVFGSKAHPAEVIVYGKFNAKGSDVLIQKGHVSMSGNLTITGSISGSVDSTGSFAHIITTGNSIEFIHHGEKRGTLKMSNDGQLDLSDKDGDITKSKLVMGQLRVGDSGMNTHVIIDRRHITASGNISASGTMLAYSVSASLDGTVDAGAYTLRNKRLALEDGQFSIKDTGLNVMGHITGSGDISGSGIHYAGHHGHQRIKILPADFKTEKVVTGFEGRMEFFGDTLTVMNDGTGAMMRNENGKMAIAQVVIPKGYKCITGFCYATAGTFRVYENEIDDKSSTTALCASTTVGSTVALTNKAATDTNYLSMAWSSNAIGDVIGGAYIDIVAI